MTKKDRQYNGKQIDKRTNNDLQNTTQKTKDRATRRLLKTHVFMRGKQFLLHMWRPLCYSFHKFGDKSWIRNGHDYDNDKQEHIKDHLWCRYSKMAESTNNNPQPTAKDWATMTPQKTGGKLMLSDRVSSSCSNSANRQFTWKEDGGRYCDYDK